MEIAQSDAAAYMDWYRIETWKAYERPEDEVTGNPSDDYERRAPGLAGMREGVRYQIYESADGHVLFMASEQAFWKNFAEGVGRVELFERWPGSKYADHARGNLELRQSLRRSSAQRAPRTGWRSVWSTTCPSHRSTTASRWRPIPSSSTACRSTGSTRWGPSSCRCP